MNRKFDCKQCKHYYVTWDASHPHGCRFFAFKSPMIPASVVMDSSQTICQAYTPKHGNATQQSGKTDDNGYWKA